MKRYRFIDYLTQFYLLVVALLIVLFHGDVVPWWQVYVAAHLACMLVIHILLKAHWRQPENRLLDLLRHFYPILLYAAFYRETGELNQMFVRGLLDDFFIGVDQYLFGCQPSIAFMDWLPYVPVSELLYASYFSYYVMIVGIGLILYFQDKRHFFHYVSIVSFVFCICYLIYIALPAVGARVFWAPVDLYPQQTLVAFPAAVQRGPFFKIMKFIYRHFEAHGAAFPSSHVAISICTLWFSWRYVPRIRYIHLVVVTLLILSTVYCRYHYIVDVFGGAAAVAILMPLGGTLYRRCGGAGGTSTDQPPA
jgi:membrane-associated phospholipid phosphatase